MNKAAASTSSESPGLYVHVPFCRSKCLYCDFYSLASPALVPEWLEAVREEALLYRGRFGAFDTLYLGGGTPTMLDVRELAELIEGIEKHLGFLPDAERTIEANPDGLTPEKLRHARKLGFNRISLGVQSLDDRDLRYLGRRHGPGDALTALRGVREAGFPRVGVDLIYGLETQTIASWKKTLDRVLGFQPEHLSCYQLTFEKGTPLERKMASGRARQVGRKLETAFFLFTSRYLARRGYLHYEISNFAAGPRAVSRHNSKYWRHAPYLGLGPSAHSFQDGKRWWNVRSVRDYNRLLSGGTLPVHGSETLTREQLDLESIYLGLRTAEGIGLAELGRLNRSPRPTDEIVRGLAAIGLARVADGRLKPTRKGFLVADSLPLQFTAQAEQLRCN